MYITTPAPLPFDLTTIDPPPPASITRPQTTPNRKRKSSSEKSFTVYRKSPRAKEKQTFTRRPIMKHTGARGPEFPRQPHAPPSRVPGIARVRLASSLGPPKSPKQAAAALYVYTRALSLKSSRAGRIIERGRPMRFAKIDGKSKRRGRAGELWSELASSGIGERVQLSLPSRFSVERFWAC